MDEALSYVVDKHNSDIGIMLTGDFNVKLDQDNKPSRRLQNIMRSYGLLPTINAPTRVQGTTANCLDNIFTNIRDYETHLNDYIISDHIPQILTAYFPKKNDLSASQAVL